MSEKEMLHEYNLIIDKMLWKHSRDFWDDLRSEAYLKFTYVRDHWEPSKGRFFSMAYHIIEQQMLNYISKETDRWARKNTYNSLDNDEFFTQNVYDHSDFERDIILKDFIEQNISNATTEFERRAKTLHYIEGYEGRDLKSMMGLLALNNPHTNEKLRKALIMHVF